MRDQIDAARRYLNAVTINSSNTAEWDAIETDLQHGAVDLLLISPERFNNADFRQRLLGPLTRNAGLRVVDEAHCISDWGHDFRPDYRRIVGVLEGMPRGLPVLCTTATANDRVVADVRQQLGDGLRVIRGSLDRGNSSGAQPLCYPLRIGNGEAVDDGPVIMPSSPPAPSGSPTRPASTISWNRPSCQTEPTMTRPGTS